MAQSDPEILNPKGIAKKVRYVGNFIYQIIAPEANGVLPIGASESR